jgi:hypothetical protein
MIMEDFDFTLALNASQIPVRIHPHIEDDKTHYDIIFEDHSITIYKDTLYTWTSDDAHGLSNDEVQSIGEQIIDPQE